MSLQPYDIAALAGQYRRDLIGHAEMYRRARATRSSCTAPARHATSLTKIIQRKITARRTILHLLPVALKPHSIGSARESAEPRSTSATTSKAPEEDHEKLHA
jgi:hypothetical protein